MTEENLFASRAAIDFSICILLPVVLSGFIWRHVYVIWSITPQNRCYLRLYVRRGGDNTAVNK